MNYSINNTLVNDNAYRFLCNCNLNEKPYDNCNSVQNINYTVSFIYVCMHGYAQIIQLLENTSYASYCILKGIENIRDQTFGQILFGDVNPSDSQSQNL